MTERAPPEAGDPVLAWEHEGRRCRVYHVGGYDATKQRGMNELTTEWVGTDWRGYVATSLTGDPSDVAVDVYGGLTALQNGWACFHTAHSESGGPETLDEMQTAVERLAEALAALERRRQ